MKILTTALLIFLFALSLRLWNLNEAGRWWDDQGYLAKSYWVVQLAEKKDFNNSFWYIDAADHPPLVTYFYGVAQKADFIKFEADAPQTFPARNMKGDPKFTYDPTNTRLVSVVISSLSVVLVFLVGALFFSFFVGVVAAMILAMIPHFLGYSQMINLEGFIMFFFTASVFAYYLYLKSDRRLFLVLTGVLTGLTLEIKQSNVLIFILYLLTFFAWRKITKNKNIGYKHFIPLGIITLITCFVVYPMPFFHPIEFISVNYEVWFKNSGLIPEVIFGRMMGARSFYYILAFFITTPLILIILTSFGVIKSLLERKKWIYIALLIWFLIPFLMTFFHARQHMVRYIIQFYAPLALLSAIGLEYFVQRFTNKTRWLILSAFLLFIYLAYIIINISPYYFNYYNELVGGTKNVYEKKWFYIGWAGEGLKGPGIYLRDHAPSNSRIGLAANPDHTMYKVPELTYEKFDPSNKYDYVVVNYFNIIRNGFDENILKNDYKVVYIEKAGGADLVKVYRRK